VVVSVVAVKKVLQEHLLAQEEVLTRREEGQDL
jgi:hypothetical protein